MSVCLSLGTSTEHVCACLEAMQPDTEMAEIRVDLLSDPEELARCFLKAKQLGIRTIATVRDEQGFTAQRQSRAMACLAAGCTYIDVEVEAPKAYQDALVSQAKKLGVVVIISHHNYEQQEASSMGLDLVIKECFEKGADVAKVAVAVCSAQGAARVLATYAEAENGNLVAIGMGGCGKVTRLACLALGSPFSFASWDAGSATAPGQLTRSEMHSGLGLLEGAGNKKARLG